MFLKLHEKNREPAMKNNGAGGKMQQRTRGQSTTEEGAKSRKDVERHSLGHRARDVRTDGWASFRPRETRQYKGGMWEADLTGLTLLTNPG